MHRCGGAMLLAIICVLSTTVHGQVIRNRLPIVTQTSVLADRLYARIVSNIDASESELALKNIAKLRAQHAGELVAIADRHQVAATLLADQLTETIQKSPSANAISNAQPVDSFSLWRSTLRGDVNLTTLLHLGDQHWLHGDITAAEQCWRLAEQKVARSERDSLIAANETDGVDALALELQKRRIVADFLTGNLRKGRKKLALFGKTYPDEIGRVAGREGNLYESLQRLAESLEDSNSEAFIRRQVPLPSNSVRYDLVSRDWSVPIECKNNAGRTVEVLLWNDVCLVQDDSGVRALAIKTGKPAWPIGPEDAGYLFETDNAVETAGAHSLVCKGGVLNSNRWYGRTGVDTFENHEKLSPPQKSRISALDLEAEGRLEWTKTPSDLSLSVRDQLRIFSGSPVIHESKLFAPLRTAKPDNRLQIACLNSKDGSEHWLIDLAANSRTAVNSERFSDHLVIEGNTIYWLIDGVVLACINSLNGEVLWISAIEPIDGFASRPKDRVYELIISEDSILCSTINGTAAFNKFTGELQWEQFATATSRQLLGVNDGLLICADAGLKAIDAEAGKIVWQHQQFSDNSKSCQGLLYGRSIFYSDQQNLLTVNAHTGRILQQDRIVLEDDSMLSLIDIFESNLVIQHGQEIQMLRAVLSENELAR